MENYADLDEATLKDKVKCSRSISSLHILL